MINEAKKRIEKEIKEKTGELNLSNCELDRIPSEVGRMTWLTKLDLDNNQISKIEGLEGLTSLARLDLDSNQISKIEGLDGLGSLATLYLGSNQISKIEGLNGLSALAILYLKSNQISKIEGLNGLSSLATLNLDSNQISKIEGLDCLSSLATLNLDSNQISKIEGLDSLSSLATLNLDNNQISKIEGLNGLSALAMLYLKSNQISKIEGLNGLSALAALYLQSNQISKIEGLDGLSSLAMLYIQSNQISKIEGLDGLSALTALSLYGNQISKIEGLDGLSALATLSLYRNQISKIEGLDGLSSLKALFIGKNPIKEIPLETRIINLPLIDISGLPIKDLSFAASVILNGQKIFWAKPQINGYENKNPDYVNLPFHHPNIKTISYKKGIYVKDCHQLKKPAPEWIKLGPQMIKNYFEAIEEQGEVELNESKVLLVGDGGVGKTSLVRRLTGQPLPKKEERTRGVDIVDWDFEKAAKKFVAHLWDFGGQIIYFQTHQFFLSQRALYLLVDSTRSGATQAQDTVLNYWLLIAELLGGGSPMLLVQNEVTGHPKPLNFGSMQQNFPFLKEYLKTNLLTEENIPQIAAIIQDYIAAMPNTGVVLPKKWLAVREAITELAEKKTIIGLEEFVNLCSAHGIEDEKGQTIMSRYFHELGAFLHYQDTPESVLANKIILNRDWATQATYMVFDDEVVKNRAPKGQFDSADIKRFWSGKAYRHHRPALIELMKKFEICYEIKKGDKKVYMVPRMMEEMPRTDYCDAAKERPLAFYYRYDFMPEGIVNRLSVRMHEFIKEECVWKNGVVFQRAKTVAEVREQNFGSDRRINIRINGPDAPSMADQIIWQIDKLNENFNKDRLKVDINVPCICTKCQKGEGRPEFYIYQQIKDDLLTGESDFQTLQCRNSRKKIDLHELMKTISYKMPGEIEAELKRLRKGKFRDLHLHHTEIKDSNIGDNITNQENITDSQVISGDDNTNEQQFLTDEEEA